MFKATSETETPPNGGEGGGIEHLQDKFTDNFTTQGMFEFVFDMSNGQNAVPSCQLIFVQTCEGVG